MSLTHSTTLNILLNCFDEAMMSLHCFIEHDRFFAQKFAFCCITQELPYRPGFENGLVLIFFLIAGMYKDKQQNVENSHFGLFHFG